MKAIKAKRLLAFISALMLLTGSVYASAQESLNAQSNEPQISLNNAADGIMDYGAYTFEHKDSSKPQNEVNAVGAEGFAVDENTDHPSGIELSAEHRKAVYSFNITESGLYNIEISYFALSGKSKDIVFSLKTDGRLPFAESDSLSVSRVYKDAGEIKRDGNGNDLRPSQVEVCRISSELLSNKDGYYDEPYCFYFEAVGSHTLSFEYFEENMIILSVILKPVTDLISYENYSKDALPAKNSISIYEAEKSYEKSSSMLYPTYDRSGPATSPSHYSKIRYNTIGQTNWSHQGQWISWEIDVPQDGWYNITLKERQNYQQGVNSYRSLYIDGEIPFYEMRNIEFPYDLNWRMTTLSDRDGNAYLFKLTKGKHILNLTVAAGPMGTVLKELSKSVLELNAIYRSIIMVTGTVPDKYRTYYLEESVPGLMDNIVNVKAKLDELYKTVEEINGTGGSQASVVLEMSVMLGQFIKKPLSIPNRVSAFKDTIESLGSVILTLSEQPLELDYIAVSSKEELPSLKAGFFETLSYSIKGFIASFVEDYNSVGSSEDNEDAAAQIKIWVSNGRDQAQILKNMIDNKFTPDSKIGVSLSIVSTAAGTSSSPLIQATLAGKGPDVALFTPKDTPINLAMRGALCDLSKLEGFDEVYKRFYTSAWIPYVYCGGTYAVPETQNYDMLFYRKDILKELGLQLPQTWDEFYTVIELLQKNNLEVGVLETNALNAGISSGISFFEKQLLQNGGAYYTDELDKTAFDTTVAYNSFRAWTELYVEYGLKRSFDFFNCFRTGEMPIGIMSYVTYNQLYAAAPEIRGLWDMAPIPGTVDESGEINRTETASGTAAVILAKSSEKEASWEFLKWWVGADAQSSYGTELEASLGVAARYDTANIEAFQSIGWSEAEAKALVSQWNCVTDIPQIPGNYFVSRCLTNAFRTVVDESENPVRALNIYNKDMNAEITRKRAEFGLD